MGLDRVANRPILKRLIRAQLDHHKFALDDIQNRKKGGKLDTLDNQVPVTLQLSHTQFNAKRAEILAVRELEMNTTNRLLLEGIARESYVQSQRPSRVAKSISSRLRLTRLLQITQDNEVQYVNLNTSMNADVSVFSTWRNDWKLWKELLRQKDFANTSSTTRTCSIS